MGTQPRNMPAKRLADESEAILAGMETAAAGEAGPPLSPKGERCPPSGLPPTSPQAGEAARCSP
jgi:hypothetical protein